MRKHGLVLLVIMAVVLVSPAIDNAVAGYVIQKCPIQCQAQNRICLKWERDFPCSASITVKRVSPSQIYAIDHGLSSHFFRPLSLDALVARVGREWQR
ncbi:MAG TPA: hypothetical protein EYP60_03575 [bacterium (Candidatus Stahlbacteria)]|nr:hypothetical protein [Candidatus Stahlbacteria bacterium]